mgnify:CR=1 FL=1
MDMSPSEHLSLADVKNRLSEVIEKFQRYPQVLLNVAVKEKKPIESLPSLVEAVRPPVTSTRPSASVVAV